MTCCLTTPAGCRGPLFLCLQHVSLQVPAQKVVQPCRQMPEHRYVMRTACQEQKTTVAAALQDCCCRCCLVLLAACCS